jgi:Terminase large subunit, T4likevirus-type, N-terminal
MPGPVIWNSVLVQQTLEKLRMGVQTDMSCFHYQDIELKAGEILYQLTSDEVDEFDKCSQDIVYFVEKYCRFLTDTGRKIVKLREYQKKILIALADEEYSLKFDMLIPKIRNLIMMQARQSGKTTTIAAYFSWYLCFHNDRNLAILANKQATAYEIVNKVTDVFKGLPFFLKPGIIQIGAGGMRLDNGCFLTSQATTKTAQIGYTIHVLYADEFAHIQHGIADDFYRSVYPTLASSEISQCVISSTPNGDDNVFYELWDKAQKLQNSFMSVRVDWWEVPGHDDEWARKMIADFGEENFAQEFGLDFTKAVSNRLLSASDIMFMSKIEREYVWHELEKTDLDDSLYQKLTWHPDFDPNADFSSKNNRFVLSVDTGEGKDEDELKDNDYNVCNIFRIEPKSMIQLKKLRNDECTIKNMFRLIQVGLYRDNIKDEENCAAVTRVLTFDQFGGNLCKVLIEMNFNGKHFLDKFSQHDEFEDGVVLHTYHTKPILGDKPPRKKAGFKVTPGNKDVFCKLGKRLVHLRIMILNEHETVKEFKAFGKTKNGKWKGIGVHDDIAMSAINISHLFEEPEYQDWLYDYLEEMEDSPIKKLINELLEKYVESTDVDDDTFNAMHQDIKQENLEQSVLQSFNDYNMPRYTPSYTGSRGGYNFPWRKG